MLESYSERSRQVEVYGPLPAAIVVSRAGCCDNVAKPMSLKIKAVTPALPADLASQIPVHAPRGLRRCYDSVMEATRRVLARLMWCGLIS